MSENGWLRLIAENPGHSAGYIERFRAMEAEGRDLLGEARCIDAMVPRGARILDAGCGQGRVGGRLAALGHVVVGVDIDTELLAAAERSYPAATWIAGDLADLDLAAHGVTEPFDVIVSAGNVVTFLDPSTRRAALARLAAHLAPDGRLVIGFGAERGYGFDEFLDDARSVGLRASLRLSTWDLQPFDSASTFLVAILTAA